MNKNFSIIGVFLVLTVVGCGTDPEVEIQRDAASENVSSAETPAATELALPDVAAFGDTVTFADGMTVTVQNAGLRPASPYAAGAVEDKIAAVQITVANEGNQAVDAAGVSALTASAGEAGTSAPPAADEGIDNPTLGSILPGETRTAMFGFGLSAADAQKLRLEIYGNDFADKVVFAGAIQ